MIITRLTTTIAMLAMAWLAQAVPALAGDSEWPSGSAMAVGLDAVKERTRLEVMLGGHQGHLIDLVSASGDERLVKALRRSAATGCAFARQNVRPLGRSPALGAVGHRHMQLSAKSI